MCAIGVLFLIVGGNGVDPHTTGLAANGYGTHSPGGYGLGAAFLTEVVMTAFFLIVILGSTSKQ